MTFRPPHIKQGDGSRCQWTNCNPASHAMAAIRHRKGVDPRNEHGWPPTPSEIRNRIGAACGGTDLNENDLALQHLYDVNLAVRYNVPFSTFRSLIVSGRGAVVSIQYSVIHGTRFDASPGFYGPRSGHGVYVNERRASDGAYLVYDPLADHRRNGIPQGPQWWPASLLRRACETYPGTNPGCIHASFTRDTEA